jgi:hypothetical protein
MEPVSRNQEMARQAYEDVRPLVNARRQANTRQQAREKTKRQRNLVYFTFAAVLIIGVGTYALFFT